MEKLVLIKVGGKIVEEENTLRQLLKDFAAIEGHKVLVHGGGRSATKLAAELGVETKMVNGRRITDADMLRIVTMVYGGLVNKNIVAKLQALGVNALGLTGADMNLIRSEKRPVKEVDYGYVGDVKEVNAELLAGLIKQGIVPILAPLTHDKEGHLLNTHADEAHGDGGQRRLLVADAVEHQAGRNAHEGIGDEVGRITQLRHPVRYRELILHDHAQRIRETRYERDHREEREHHDDG